MVERGSSELHSLTVDEILIALSPYCVLWKNPIGVGKCIYTGNIIKFGLTGSPDIIGWIRKLGLFIGIEVKTGEAVLGPDQKKFRDLCLRDGGPLHLVVRRSPNYLDELKTEFQSLLEKTSPSLLK